MLPWSYIPISLQYLLSACFVLAGTKNKNKKKKNDDDDNDNNNNDNNNNGTCSAVVSEDAEA